MSITALRSWNYGFFLWAMSVGPCLAGETPADTLGALPDSASRAAEQALKLQEFEASLHYRHGRIVLGDGLAALTLDTNAGYLDPVESEKVLVDFWGNPPGFETLGMIFPEGQKATTPDGWAVILSFDEDGYVKDDDAADLDYGDLLKKMKQEVRESNEQRRKEGYGTVELLGWAETPSYDSVQKKMYWAKSLRFDGNLDTTLNYNVRILGRRGVLVLNAVANVSDLSRVRKGMLPLMQAIEFENGHRYADFDPKLDKVATYGIAGLVAGAALMKVGFLKGLIGILLAAKKLLLIGGVAAVAFISKLLGKRKEKKDIADDQVRRIDDGRA
jgi:uncharacterized membrane-anchored protein